jgi:ABC-2 type transport system permease protein
VWTAKALAVLLTAVAVSTVVLLVFWAAVAALAASRDITTSDAVWRGIAAMSGRGVVTVAAAGLIGYAATMLFRSTVATLALGFGAAAGGTVLLLSLLGDVGNRWLPSLNAEAFLLDGAEYYAWTPECEQQMQSAGWDGVDPCVVAVSQAQGATYWIVIIVVLVALSVGSFRRRDLP